MALKNSKEYTFVISKMGMDDWFLYAVGTHSYGKRIEWTHQISDALVFTTEQRLESFREKVLKNIPVVIHMIVRKP